MAVFRVLFVCLGNICRSPMAEGVLRNEAAKAGATDTFEIESAGTGSWHIGNPPDPRAQAAALERGADISALRGRLVDEEDFERFDLMVAMDRANYAVLKRMAPKDQVHKLRLAMSFVDGARVDEVPDPYFGEGAGFEHVLDLLGDVAQGILAARREGRI